jgi:heptaprenylglyceryl phosphate synthase
MAIELCEDIEVGCVVRWLGPVVKARGTREVVLRPGNATVVTAKRAGRVLLSIYNGQSVGWCAEANVEHVEELRMVPGPKTIQ